MASTSRALSEFKLSLGMAEELMRIDRIGYRNPPRRDEQLAVQGLRGGAVVLMVAAFESFLRAVFEEHLDAFASVPPKRQLSVLPMNMQVHHVFTTLSWAMNGVPHRLAGSRASRIPEIENASRMIISGALNTAAFCETGGNPHPPTVKEMYKAVGVSDVFSVITPQFEKEWKSPVAS